METEQLIQLIQAVSVSELTQFKYEEKGVKLSLRKRRKKDWMPYRYNCRRRYGKSDQFLWKCNFREENVRGRGKQIGFAERKKQENLEQNCEGVQEKPEGTIVTSPLVGTFYEAPAEEKRLM